jgi:hypothetical protein
MAGQKITDNGRLIALHRTFTASPTITAISQFRVGTGTTNPTSSNTAMETAVNINGGQLKNIVTSYPILDTTNFQSTVRAFLTSLEANSNTLTEMGTFNTDGTPLLFSRATFTGIAKTSSIEVTFIEKDKVTAN